MYFFFFFFQAEDGIRDYKVTGVQSCALPICGRRFRAAGQRVPGVHVLVHQRARRTRAAGGSAWPVRERAGLPQSARPPGRAHRPPDPRARSEEHTSELQSPCNLVCRLLLEKKNTSELQSPCNLVCRLLLEKKKTKHSNTPLQYIRYIILASEQHTASLITFGQATAEQHL